MKQLAFVRSLLAIVWLAVIVAIILLALRQPAAFDSSIMSLLPKSQQQPLVQLAIEQASEGFSKGLIVLLSGDDEDEVQVATGSLAASLASLSDVSSVRWRVQDDELQQLQTELFPYRFVVIDEGLRTALLAGQTQQVKEQALWRLYSPLTMGKSSITEDPFALFSALTLNRGSDLKLQVTNGLLKVSGAEKPTYMLLARLAVEPYSPDLQQRLLGALEAQQKQLAAAGISLQKSGMLMHAAAGAQQAKAEMSSIGLGSLFGIVVIMWLVFRQFKPLLLMLLAVAVGCLCATGVTLLVFERVHLITFAFGAGLVGVSIDYALHYLCESRVSSAHLTLSKLLPGLLLGLLSSVLAYAAMALTPFPGLRQMATFSVVGLLASWLTVVLWFPVLIQTKTQQTIGLAARLGRMSQRLPSVQGNPVLVGVICVLLMLSLLSLWHSETQDDIRLLQTSPASLLAQEQAVQQKLGVSSSTQFLLVTGASLQQCLQREEQLRLQLDSLKQQGSLADYQALSRVLPSLQRQSENRQLVEQLYEQQLVAYFETLKLPAQALSAARLNFGEAQALQLTPALWQQQQGSGNWKKLIIEQHDGSIATMIRFSGSLDETLKQQLITLAEQYPDVSYVDQVQNVTELMSSYRNQVMSWVLLAYLVVGLILLTRYKAQAWRVLLPPLLASFFTLAILVQLQHSVNLFHLMALILVLGIGLDMGIFLNESGGALHTWLAVTLSALTSLLAFGLLALSKTPVLHHFGLTVLLALSCSWLLATMMKTPTDGDTN